MRIAESIVASAMATIFGCIAAAFIWYLLTCFPGACQGNDFYVAFAGIVLFPILVPLCFVGYPIIYIDVEKRPWSKEKRRNMFIGLGVVIVAVVGALTIMFQPPTFHEWVLSTAANGAVLILAWLCYFAVRRGMST